MEQKVVEKFLVDYDVTSEFAGHQSNKQVPIIEAAKDIFAKVKEKSMQLAVKGFFIEFANVDELITKLKDAVVSGYSIRVYDDGD